MPGPQRTHPESPAQGGQPPFGVAARWLSVTVLAMLVLIAATVVGAAAIASSDAQRSRQAFRSSSAEIAASIDTAIDREEDLVVNTRSYIAEHPDISPTGFARWAGSVRAFARYPELRNFGFVKVIPAAALRSFKAEPTVSALGPGGRAAEPAGSLAIVPGGARPYYCLAVAGVARSAATYLSPGTDFCALAPRLYGSRATGQSFYAPFQGLRGQAALGLETPVYRGASTPRTAAARLSDFIGWEGDLLTPGVVIARAVRSYPGVAVSMSYTQGSQHVVFDSGRPAAHPQTVTIGLHNGWRIATAGAGVSAAIFANLNATLLLLGGALLTLLLGALFFVLTTSRQRALAMVAEKTRELTHLALHDGLTGLPNRTLVLDRARRMLTRSRRSAELHTGVMFIDVDDFKEINDEFGHAAGDHVLRLVAARLTGAVRAQDTVGRLGGDEFVVLAETDGEGTTLRVLAERIISSLDQRATLPDGADVPLTVSIGVTQGRSENAEELLHRADTALYRAKAEGKNRYVVNAP